MTSERIFDHYLNYARAAMKEIARLRSLRRIVITDSAQFPTIELEYIFQLFIRHVFLLTANKSPLSQDVMNIFERQELSDIVNFYQNNKPDIMTHYARYAGISDHLSDFKFLKQQIVVLKEANVNIERSATEDFSLENITELLKS